MMKTVLLHSIWLQTQRWKTGKFSSPWNRTKGRDILTKAAEKTKNTKPSTTYLPQSQQYWTLPGYGCQVHSIQFSFQMRNTDGEAPVAIFFSCICLSNENCHHFWQIRVPGLLFTLIRALLPLCWRWGTGDYIWREREREGWQKHITSFFPTGCETRG